MKSLKFTPALCDLILSGEKTSTWRLFDDKDLQLNDKIIFLNNETKNEIGFGEITNLKVTTFNNLSSEDWGGHEVYSSKEEMIKTYRGYYGDKVGLNTELKIIHFSFSSK
jgi:hypothetical protein